MLYRKLSQIIAVFSILILAGCNGVSTEQQPDLSGNQPPADYSGPLASSSDVTSFKTNVWDNLRSKSCGNCHTAGNQSPMFVRSDDINLAYDAALTVVDRTTPSNSMLVKKVANGHNCWLSSNSECADKITSWLEAWLLNSSSVPSQPTSITLTAPASLSPPGSSKVFPSAPGNFETTIWPLLTTNCAGCHTDTATTPQAPYFAHSDVNVAYEAIKTTEKIDLNNPANSRVVVRLRGDFHNCWSDCQSDATEMETAITNFANGITSTPIDSALVNSMAMKLHDGIIASGGNRIDTHAIALYKFKSGSGSTIIDSSGVDPQLNLTLNGTEGSDYKWVGGWGVELISSKAFGNTQDSRKLAQRIRQSGEYSVEAWLVPANVSQEGPARIISYSASSSLRNFTMGQTLYNYDFMHRSTTTDANGEPMLSTPDADEVLQATQQHVVMTYDVTNGRRIYVNGQLTNAVDDVTPGSLVDWDDSYALLFGDETSSDNPWQGKLRLVAIHDRALSYAQVLQNYQSGVGEKYFLLFSISHLINVPESYIVLQVSQFDDYSYLFTSPRYVSLDSNATAPANIQLSGMRIGINGKESVVGQVYKNINLSLNSLDQTLSSMGTVIPLEIGASLDEFFITFEQLGSHSNVVVEPSPLTPAPPADGTPQPDIGLRTFDEVNATMSVVTGISQTEANVQTTYQTIKQQLPSAERIDGFLSAHQVAVSQLAIEYCNALIEDTTHRSSYFPGFDFSAPAATAFDTVTKRDLLIDPLLSNMLGSNLSTQPADVDVKTELNNLIDSLSLCVNTSSCTSDRTVRIAKGTCAAVLGSAALLIQ